MTHEQIGWAEGALWVMAGCWVVLEWAREKGRKRNYYQYDVLSGKAEKHERLLNTAGLASAVEVSCRAASCPNSGSSGSGRSLRRD